MKNILAFAGSTSKASINKTFASYVAQQVKGVNTTVVDLNDYSLPLYSYDLENEKGIPKVAHAFSELISNADGIVMSLAEHNGFTTAAFKNLIDWLSRIDKNVWKNKATLLLSTSPGAHGGTNVMRLMKEMMPHLGGHVVADFSLASFYDNFSEEGLKDVSLNSALRQSIAIFEKSVQ